MEQIERVTEPDEHRFGKVKPIMQSNHPWILTA